MSENNKKDHSQHRPSVFGPMLLITAGIIFLANNLGIVSSSFWDTIVNLWPLLLVFAGIDGLVRRDGIVWPLLLIIVGVFLTLRNFGVIAWGEWGRLWSLWPLIFVALGVDIIFKEHSSLGSIFRILAILLLVGGGIWLVGFYSNSSEGVSVEAVHQPMGEEITEAQITLSMSAGEMDVNAAGEKATLIEGKTASKAKEFYHEKGTLATYTLKCDSPVALPSRGRWDLGISTQIPFGLSAEMGAGEIVLRLEELRPENLVIEQGVGNIKVRLPARGLHHAEISQAIGQIQVVIAKGTAIRLEVSKAIATLDIPPDFSRKGNYYYSPNYDEADDVINLSISQAIGKIEVTYSK
ncbi:MAG: hypothetical protein B6I38_01485 [Anaerolineaceae bacterium 4572_5.1]|nr:MAG: hypothetical protein B6I38_01485 [Anaerolineaceae bacterium 4572_5.1]